MGSSIFPVRNVDNHLQMESNLIIGNRLISHYNSFMGRGHNSLDSTLSKGSHRRYRRYTSEEKEVIIKEVLESSDAPEYFPSDTEFEKAGYPHILVSIRKSKTEGVDFWRDKLGLKAIKGDHDFLKSTRARKNKDLFKRLNEHCSKNQIDTLDYKLLETVFQSSSPNFVNIETGEPMKYSEIAEEAGLWYFWDERTIEHELQNLMGELNLKRFPYQKEFIDNGYSSLMMAMRRTGGLQSWAEKLEIPRKSPGAGVSKTIWNDELIESRLLKLVETHGAPGQMPRHSEMQKYDLPLWGAITRGEGFLVWANKLGLEIKTARSREPESSLKELKDLCKDLEINTFPTVKMFRAHGKSGLEQYIRKNGGRNVWAAKAGLELTS